MLAADATAMKITGDPGDYSAMLLGRLARTEYLPYAPALPVPPVVSEAVQLRQPGETLVGRKASRLPETAILPTILESTALLGNLSVCSSPFADHVIPPETSILSNRI